MPKFVSPDVTEVYDVMLTYAGKKEYGDVFSCSWVTKGRIPIKSWELAAMRWIRNNYQRAQQYKQQKPEQSVTEERSSNEPTPREQILRKQNDGR
jgi:hypothetical protein